MHDDQLTIIDGQQRIATAMLMITAIYHLIQDDSHRSRYQAQDIHDDLLYDRASSDQKTSRLKLRTVSQDGQIFQAIYRRDQEIKADYQTSNLYRAYRHFYDYFLKIGSNLDKYIDALKKLIIATIYLESGDNLQKVFESINSTGVSLTVGDKIRNFALMLNSQGVRQKVARDYWPAIEKQLIALTVARNKDPIAEFFRKLMIQEERRDSRISEVYRSFKKYFNDRVKDQSDPNQISQFYDNIMAGLQRYLFLKNPYEQTGNHPYQPFARAAFRLAYLNIDVIQPFLMRILKDYDQEKLTQGQVLTVLGVTETYLVRRALCDKYSTGLNKIYLSVNRGIDDYLSQYPEADLAEIYKYLILNLRGYDTFPDDKTVSDKILESNLADKTRYRYLILSSYDDCRQSRESFLLRQIDSGQSRYSIEHIMPQKLSSVWKKDLGPDHDQIQANYLNNLANLTLTGYNQEYSNRSLKRNSTMNTVLKRARC